MMNIEAAGSVRGGVPAGRRCEDCGNQAKRECKYVRCRRCCNRRKLECPTHVSSTWVPTSFRRLRQAAARGTHPPTSQQENHVLLHRRDHHNPSDPGSDNFPKEVSSLATFQCCRVSSMLDGGDRVYEYAYRTSVSIGGHLFKGILYDQAPRNDNVRERRESSTIGVVVAPFSCPSPLPTSATSTQAFLPSS